MSTAESTEGWDAASSGYAEQIAPRLMEPYADTFVEALATQPDDAVLEVGAGSGALTATLATRVGSLVATDFSPAMVALLTDRMASLSNVEVRVMDGQDLAFDDNSFDAAACSFALMLFPDRAKGFSELARVVRPGGRVIVTTWAGPEKFEGFGVFLQAMQQAFPDLAAPPSPVFSLSDPALFQTEFEAGGFNEVEIREVARELEIESFAAFWGLLTVGAPPVQVLFDQLGEDGREHLRSTLAGIVQERWGDGPITVTNVALLGSGVVA